MLHSMDRWEYNTFHIRTDSCLYFGLGPYGRDGWELVQFLDNDQIKKLQEPHNEDNLIGVFKRRLS